MQYGHLFSLPSGAPSAETIMGRLTSSLSVALSHFPPLAGHFAIDKANGGFSVQIDCDDRGALFRVASAKTLCAEDVLAESDYVPAFVRDLFPYDGPVNYDGTSLHLLAVQLTKLQDGVFLGCSINHAVCDGTAFWNFFNAWAEISRSPTAHLRLCSVPLLERWFPDDCQPPIGMPFAEEDEFIERYSPPPLKDKFFHFKAPALARLKAEANKEVGVDNISSLQALTACMWRCVIRARRLPENEMVVCGIAADIRRRLHPPLPAVYFGNSLSEVSAAATVGELLGRGIGWAAKLINETVALLTDSAIREVAQEWMKAPVVYPFSAMEKFSVFVGLSPRFDMYGCDFGWGKAVAVRSGSADKFDGMISAYPGREGCGSIDFEISLLPETMAALERDTEFMQVVS